MGDPDRLVTQYDNAVRPRLMILKSFRLLNLVRRCSCAAGADAASEALAMGALDGERGEDTKIADSVGVQAEGATVQLEPP